MQLTFYPLANTRASTRRSFARRPLRVRLLSLLVVVPLAIGCPGPDEPTPTPTPEVPQVRAESTRVVIAALSPLTLEVHHDREHVGTLGGLIDDDSAPGHQQCHAFSLGIRPRSDDGGRYHDVEAPAEDLEWFFPSDDGVAATAAPEDAPAGSEALALQFVSPESSRVVDATVVIMPTSEGFVAVDAHFDVAEGDVAMLQSCFRLLDAEEGNRAHVVGGGERFDGVDLVSRVIPLAFRAPARFKSNTNESHAPIPFFATARGLGVLVETERVGAFDAGASVDTKLFARFHGVDLPLRVRAAARARLETGDVVDFNASAIVNNVSAHARFMGLPKRLPAWALAPQQWRNELDVTVENDVVIESGRDRLMADVGKMRSFDIPGSLIWIDAPWSTGFNSFEFNREQFPDVNEMFEEVHQQGYHLIVWATEHINRSDDSPTLFGMPPFATLDDYQRFADRGFFVRNADGTPFSLSWGRGVGGFLDFTNPAAVEAWNDRIRPLLQQGVRGFKLDYGETMRADLLGLGPNDAVTFSDGTTTRVQHTRYQRLYHEAYLTVLQEVWGDDHFIITRTGGIYDQKNGVTLWPGDLDNDFSLGGVPDENGTKSVGGLRAAISAGLSASMSGYPYYGSDIGGYRGGPPTTEVLVRWAQFGAYSIVMQLGGGGTGDQTHNPWDEALYDVEVALPAYQKVSRTHMELLPYLETLVAAASDQGRPPLVPLGAVLDLDDGWADIDAYFLGNDVFVAPVVVPGAIDREIRFPPGRWIGIDDGTLHEGLAKDTVAAPLDVIPAFVRAGAVIPLLDPRVDTVIEAAGDDDIVDLGDVEPSVRVRTSAGPYALTVLPDGTELEQETTPIDTVVTLRGPTPQRFVVDLWLRDDTGPTAQTPVDGLAATERAVSTYAELFTCEVPCQFRDGKRISVATAGQNVEVIFAQTP